MSAMRAYGGSRDALINELAFENLEVREFDAGKWLLARGVPQGSEGTIDVEVQDRIVTLNGRVPGLPSKRLAGVLAWWVPGVRDVVNGIELGSACECGPDQGWRAQDVGEIDRSQPKRNMARQSVMHGAFSAWRQCERNRSESLRPAASEKCAGRWPAASQPASCQSPSKRPRRG